MSLRQRISLTANTFRFGGFAVLAASTIWTKWPGVGLGFGVTWLLFGSPFLRKIILPSLFPTATCPGSGRTMPLVGRWKCGGHYTDHADRHVLAFLCPQGHRIEGFDCPRCSSTILVQYGDRPVLKSGSAIRLKALTKLPEMAGLLIGHDRKRKPVNLPASVLAWHVAITGGTGRGKSTLLGNLACQMAENGTGFTLLDPGGDLAQSLLQQIPPNREEDVLYLNVADRILPFPLNVLHARTDLERAVLVEELLGVFHKLYGSSWGPMLSHQLRMALKAAMEVGGTLQDVYSLFTDNVARTRLVAQLRDPMLRMFWTGEFPSIPAVRRSAVTNKLAPIVFHPILGRIIAAKSCILDADQAIRERKIVIVNLATGSPGDDVTTLLGTFLVHKTIAAAFRQTHLPPPARVPHVLIVDEFQRFMHRAAAFDQILAEARKYKLSLIVANQYVEQLPTTVRAALFGNVGCLAAFRVGHRDAKVLEPEFTGCNRDELTELNRGECLVRMNGDWTLVRTHPPRKYPVHDPSDQIIAATREQIEPSTSVDVQADANDIDDEDNDDELVQ